MKLSVKCSLLLLFIGCALAIPLPREWAKLQVQVEQPAEANLLVVDGETWSYIGCFQDDRAHDLETLIGYGYDQDTCQTACAQYAYFALQDGGECFCDNSYSTPPSSYPKVDDSTCGDVDGLGGAWANSVYSTGYDEIQQLGESCDGECLSSATCPERYTIVACEFEGSGNGCYIDGNTDTCYAEGSSTSITAVATCSASEEAVVMIGSLDSEGEEGTVTVACPRGVEPCSCNCRSDSGACGDSPADASFAPINGVCTGTYNDGAVHLTAICETEADVCDSLENVEEVCEDGKTDYCEVYTESNGQTCDAYCESTGFECIAGYDTLGDCASKVTDDADRSGDGCGMAYDSAICECGIPCDVGARFIDNLGLELEQNDGPVDLGDATWLFGAEDSGSGLYKMCRVTLSGVVLECRAMSPENKLTEANWDEATIPGDYDVQEIHYSTTCSKLYFVVFITGA
jgi:hypothetical protein